MQKHNSFLYFFILFEVLILILYGVFTEFQLEYKSQSDNLAGIINFYPMFQDIHVMIFVGFGFLMTFLKQASWQGVAYTYIIAILCIQWGILNIYFWQCVYAGVWKNVKLDITWLIQGDFTAATILISFGALLGKVNALQLLVMSVIEVMLYALNLEIGIHGLHTNDIGGAIFIHTFGAYFGLACSYVYSTKAAVGHQNNRTAYQQTLIAMVGTLFLWIYWPSFNAALAVTVSGNSQIRTAVNTLLSLTGSCFSAFAMSTYYNKGKFEMEDILNATLAGGVIMGAASDLITMPFASLLCGLVAGIVSTIGFRRLSGILQKKFGLTDTCGINNLHGMPGILGSIISAICCASMEASNFGGENAISDMFIKRNKSVYPNPRTAVQQGGIQIAALIITLLIALIFGAITGKIIKHPFFQTMSDSHLFQDIESFELPPEEEHEQSFIPKPKEQNEPVQQNKNGVQELANYINIETENTNRNHDNNQIDTQNFKKQPN